jgi:hypothetical protein
MFKFVVPKAARLILAATLLCVPVAGLTAAAPVAAAAQTYCQTKTASYYQGVVMTGNLMATITGTACWSPGLNGGVWGSSMKLWTQYSAIGRKMGLLQRRRIPGPALHPMLYQLTLEE